MTVNTDLIVSTMEDILNSNIDLNTRKDDVKELLKELKKVNKRLNKVLKISDRIQSKDYAELQISLSKIGKLNNEIENTQREVVFTMGTVAEFRSNETGLHVQRVSLYSKIIGKHYGLNEREIELLFHAAPMHDIGKIAIPDAILNKPGKLNFEEFEIMKTHAHLGYRMISNSDRPLLAAASIIAHEHHEKWDGSGYPRGLVGNDIHIYGRITALADVFDALGSKRCYKDSWKDDLILNFIREQSGKHFDPELVDIFFIHLDEIIMVQNELQNK